MIQGLVAAGENPAGPAWTKSGHTALTNVLTFQDAANGGFTYPGNPGPDAFTTSQVPAGLAKVPFPGSTAWTAGASAPGRAVCGGSAVPDANRQQPAGRNATSNGDRPAVRPIRPRPDDGLPILVLAGAGALVIGGRAWSRRPSR